MISEVLISGVQYCCPSPNPPTNITPTNIAWLKLSGKSPLGLGIPPLRTKIMLESNRLKSTMLVGGLGVRLLAQSHY